MVKPNYIYVIDSSFLFDKTVYDFYLAEMLYYNNEDITYFYGFLKSFLKVINGLDVQTGTLIISKEALALLGVEKLNIIIKLLDRLEVSVVKDVSKTSMDICSKLHEKNLRIITQNKSMNVFLNKGIDIIIIDPSGIYKHYTKNKVKTQFEVGIDFLNTYIALSNISEKLSLKKKQIVRLINLYGDLNAIFKNIQKLSTRIKNILIKNQQNLLSRFNYFESITHQERKNRNIQVELLIKNKEIVKKNIISLGFPSLVRLFSKTEKMLFSNGSNNKLKAENKQVIINDTNGLNHLKALFSSEEFVAIDTETDNKDPRKAKLLAISLSFFKNKAYFIPFLKEGLKEITPQNIICFFKDIEQQDIKIIGHNIKYDVVVLHKHNISLNNIYFDTMIAAGECYGDIDFLNLKYLANKFLNENIKSYKDIAGKKKIFWIYHLKHLLTMPAMMLYAP